MFFQCLSYLNFVKKINKNFFSGCLELFVCNRSSFYFHIINFLLIFSVLWFSLSRFGRIEWIFIFEIFPTIIKPTKDMLIEKGQQIMREKNVLKIFWQNFPQHPLDAIVDFGSITLLVTTSLRILAITIPETPLLQKL